MNSKSDKTILDRRRARVIPGTVVVAVVVVAAAVAVADDNVVDSAVAVVVGKYEPVITRYELDGFVEFELFPAENFCLSLTTGPTVISTSAIWDTISNDISGA